ncbi:MAG: hypothetical protein PHX83_14350 [Acidobacteriia bacterium]|nr:hypothetical protein [Terriglobia bacterium]
MTSKRFFPDTVLAVLGLVSLVVLWANVRNAKMYPSNARSILYFYVLPVILFLVFAGMFWLKESFRSNFAFVAVCVLLPLYGTEYILQRPIDPHTREWTNRTGMTKLEMIVQLRVHGVQAYPCVYPISFVHTAKIQTMRGPLQPLGGISRVTTVFCNEGDRIVAYNSDDHGFNNPQRNWGRDVKVLALGDSFLHGDCVAPDRNLSADLNREVGSTVALGMGGNGPFEELGGIKEYLPYLHPKIVLWFYYEGNDLADTHRDKSDPLLVRYLEPGFSQDLYHRQDEIDLALKKLADPDGVIDREVRNASPFFGFLKLRVFRARLNKAFENVRGSKEGSKEAAPIKANEESGEAYSSDYSDEDLILFGKILTEARDFISKSGGQLIFVYLPSWERYGMPQSANRDRSRVLQWVSAQGIPSVDIDPMFSKTTDPKKLFLYTGGQPGHYNSEGYQRVSDTVRNFVEKGRHL